MGVFGVSVNKTVQFLRYDGAAKDNMTALQPFHLLYSTSKQN